MASTPYTSLVLAHFFIAVQNWLIALLGTSIIHKRCGVRFSLMPIYRWLAIVRAVSQTVQTVSDFTSRGSFQDDISLATRVALFIYYGSGLGEAFCITGTNAGVKHFQKSVGVFVGVVALLMVLSEIDIQEPDLLLGRMCRTHSRFQHVSDSWGSTLCFLGWAQVIKGTLVVAATVAGSCCHRRWGICRVPAWLPLVWALLIFLMCLGLSLIIRGYSQTAVANIYAGIMIFETLAVLGIMIQDSMYWNEGIFQEPESKDTIGRHPSFGGVNLEMGSPWKQSWIPPKFHVSKLKLLGQEQAFTPQQVEQLFGGDAAEDGLLMVGGFTSVPCVAVKYSCGGNLDADAIHKLREWPLELERVQTAADTAWHPNILNVLGVVVNLPFAYLVIEWCRPVPESRSRAVCLRQDADISRCAQQCIRAGLSAPTRGAFVTTLEIDDIGLKNFHRAEAERGADSAMALTSDFDAWDLKLAAVPGHLSELASFEALRSQLSCCPPEQLEFEHWPQWFSSEAARELRLAGAEHISEQAIARNVIRCFAQECLVPIDGDALGEGEFGDVSLRGLWIGGECTRVAVKRLRGPDCSSELISEAGVMGLIGPHPNVIQLVGVCLTPPLMILELVEEKQEADKWVALQADRVVAAVMVLRDCAAALAHLHSHVPGIIHRDIAPRNVLVTNRGQAKLCDFGLAARTSGGRSDNGDLKLPHYSCPPENFWGDGWGFKSDVWQFGIMLIELVRGGTVWPQKGDEEDDDWLINGIPRGIVRPVRILPAITVTTNPMCSVIDPVSTRVVGRPTRMEKLQEVADQCTQHHSRDRPMMFAVLSELEVWLVDPEGQESQDKEETKEASFSFEVPII